MTKNTFSRAVITLLCVFMLFSSVQVVHGGIVAITDINKHWAKTVINKWIEKGYTNGYKDNTFKPDNTITRAEFIALINRSFGFTEKAEIAFTDAKPKDWFYEDAAKAVKAGYTTGCTETTICPNKQITRREAAVMISRLLHLGGTVIGDSSMFEDSNEFADWGSDEIGITATTKIMTGYLDAASGSTTFKANNKIKRAEAIVSLDRALTYKANTFNLAGLYGPTTGSKTVEGDVSIQVSGVTLQNMIISGNLVISDQIGEGDATLKNVVVKGTTTVNGGGANSIHLENVSMESLVVNKAAGSVRVVAEGSTKITNTTVQSSAILEEASSLKTQGFQTVTLNGAESGAATVVTLNGTFDKINLNGQSVQITMPNGSIQAMTVSEQASGNSLNMSANVILSSLILNAQMAFTGQGTIQSAMLNDSAVDSPFEKKPTILKGANGAVIVPPAPPAFTSVVAVNSGNNVGLGAGDSVVITFDQNTNKPAITAANLSTWITINSGHSFGTSLLNSDIIWNATGNILTIFFSNTTGTTFVVGDTLKIQAAANLKNASGTTVASVAVSAASTGSFTSAPLIKSVVAADTGKNDGLGVGDSVAITFDQNTNRSPIKAANLNAVLLLNNGHSFGNLLDRDITWNSTGNILTITFSNITATTFAVGDTVTVTTGANISNAGGTVASNATSAPSSGSFTTYLEVTSVVAANAGKMVGLNAGDTVTITFSTLTNHPTITAANFKLWFTIMSGHSWGNLSDSNIRWTNNQVLTITFTDPTGVTFVPGDSILINQNVNIRDSANKYPLNYILTPASTGGFSDAPTITRVVVADTGNNAGKGVGDTITLYFDQPTNKPALPGNILDTLLTVSGGHSFGKGLANGNIYWDSTGTILTINLNITAGVTFEVGDKITPTKAANIKDAAGLSLESVSSSPNSTGSFSPQPATPSVVSIVAANKVNGAIGLNSGDTISITFNQETNKPPISAANLNKWLIATNGDEFGTVSSASWSGKVLTITFGNLPTPAKYIKIGDTFQLSAEANIKDTTGTSNALSGTIGTLTGSFSSPPTINKVLAVNSNGDIGLTAGDSLEIHFDKPTNRPMITAAQLSTWFTISNTHSFGTALNDYDIQWDESGNVLTITFSDVTGTSIKYGDTIQVTQNAIIMDSLGLIKVSTAVSPTVTGSFTTNPKIYDFYVNNPSNNSEGKLLAGDTITIVFDQLMNRPTILTTQLNSIFLLKDPYHTNAIGTTFPGGSEIRSIKWSTTSDGLDCLNIVLDKDIPVSDTAILINSTSINLKTAGSNIIKDVTNSLSAVPSEEGYEPVLYRNQ